MAEWRIWTAELREVGGGEERRLEETISRKRGQSAFLKLKAGGWGLEESPATEMEMEMGRWSEPEGSRVSQEQWSAKEAGAREMSGEERCPVEEKRVC